MVGKKVTAFDVVLVILMVLLSCVFLYPLLNMLALSFCGGSVGGILGMILFRHKIRKSYFAVGLPLILCTQAIVMLYAANFAWQSI